MILLPLYRMGPCEYIRYAFYIYMRNRVSGIWGIRCLLRGVQTDKSFDQPDIPGLFSSKHEASRNQPVNSSFNAGSAAVNHYPGRLAFKQKRLSFICQYLI